MSELLDVRRLPMRTLILYSSKYGFTERVANILADHIDGDVIVERCVKDYSVDLTKFDNVIMGSSVYVSKPNIALLDFCDSYQRLLMNKKIGYFVTGGMPDEAMDVIEKNYPENLVRHAKAKGYFGHAYDFEKMRFFDKLVTMIITRKSESEIRILGHEIEAFAEQFEI